MTTTPIRISPSGAFEDVVTGTVDTVFGRSGNVIAVVGDYAASQVSNDSTVAGGTVADALDGVDADVMALQATVATLANVQLESPQGDVVTFRPTIKVRGAGVSDDGVSQVLDTGVENVRGFGATTLASETTITAGAGSTTPVLAAAAGYVDGNWMFVHQGGSAHNMATPGTPIAVVQGTTGGTQWEFWIVALTAQWGMSAPSAVPVSVANANATLSATNFVEVWPDIEVPGASAYLVYARKNGVGSSTYRGAIAANLIQWQGGQAIASSFRLVSEAAVGGPTGVPSVLPVAAVPNGMWTRIVSGGGTTLPTVAPALESAVAGVVCEPCNVKAFEDAIRYNIASNISKKVWVAPSANAAAYRFSGSLRIAHPIHLAGVEVGPLSASVLLMKDGHGVAWDGASVGQTRVPGGQYRVGDRIMPMNLPALGIFEVTSIAAGAEFGFAASTAGDPAWTLVNGATYVDGDLTLTYRTTGQSSAQHGHMSGLMVRWTTKTIPPLRVSGPRDLKTTWQEVLTAAGATAGLWLDGLTFVAGYYTWPSNANATGKRYRCSVGGVAGAEPVWPRHHGDTVNSGACTFVCEDDERLAGAGVLLTTPTQKVRLVGIQASPGWAIVSAGDIYVLSAATDNAAVELCWQTQSVAGALLVYGSDGQTGRYHIQSSVVGSRVSYAVVDASLYGNIIEGASHTGVPAQNRKQASVQSFSILQEYYQEGTPLLNDWNAPGRSWGGNAYGRAAGATAPHIGGDKMTDIPRYDLVGTFFEYLTAGVQWRVWSGSTSTLTWAWRLVNSLLSTTGRIREQWNADDTETIEEHLVYSARGRLTAFLKGILTGTGGVATEGLIRAVTAVPTTGCYNGGDYLPWVTTTRAPRKGLYATQRGILGASARANSTVYAREAIYTSAARAFAVIKTGTSAAAPPAALATAVFGQRIADGTAWVECWGTDQPPLLRADPVRNDPVALADADATIQITAGNSRVCDAATAARAITLGVIGAVPGDHWWIRNPNSVAFTWTFTNGGPGGGVIHTFPVLSPNEWLLAVMNDAGDWQVDMSADS